jgi:7-cyano-7-deazaguanine synthase
VRSKGAGYLAGRNAFLICLALLETEMKSGIVSLGLHGGTDYWDSSASFAKTVQVIVDGYTHGKIRLSLPFLDWTKRDIWDFCLRSGVPVELTYSCELGGEQPCDYCLSCRDREALRAS